MIYRRVKTNISSTLDSMNQKKAIYDDYAKLILADPQVLANIIKVVVAEFKDIPVNEIVPCIGETEISLSVPEQLMVKVGTCANEDIEIDSGKIIYDIKFPLYYNNKERTYIINIEAQKSTRASKLGYELINRMIYYICRMVSSQKGTEFIHSDYDNLKNVYSIWICMDAREGEETIVKYGMQPEVLYGSEANVWSTELINGAVIKIRTDKNQTYKKSKNRLIEMLELLFSDIDSELKSKELEHDFGMKMTTELKGVADEMCNISDLIEERATERGMAKGMAKGERRLLASQIVKKIKNNKNLSVIAMELEQEESDIMPVYEAVLKAAPDYDIDYILSLLEER